MKKILNVRLLFLLTTLLPCQIVFGQLEAKLYAITTWDGGCSGSARGSWDDMGLAWYDEITDKGFNFLGFWIGGHGPDAYSRDGSAVNGSIADSWFTDDDKVSWGNDDRHVDEADAAMICLHGSESGGRWQGSVRIDESGSGNCTTQQGDMEFGDVDLEFLHLSSCNSLDDNQWVFEWLSSFDGLHQVDGFHGLMWIGSGMVDDYSDFANDAFHTTIADAWLDNMYRPDISGSDDQCPVTYAVGSNSADMWNRIGTEQYNNVHSDPNNIGYVGWIYIEGCNPANEDVIGDDVYSGSADAVIVRNFSSKYKELVVKALPTWNDKILRAPVSQVDWINNILPDDIAKSVNDKTKFKKTERMSLEEINDSKNTRSVKIDRTRGYVRYINKDLAFKYNVANPQVLDSLRSIEVARSTLQKLRIPVEQARKFNVDRVIGMGSKLNATKPDDQFVKEILLTANREINDIPVFNSSARLAITPQAKISRMLIKWPTFNLQQNLKLKDRDALIEEIVAELEREEEGKPVSITIQLAYLPKEDDDKVSIYYPGIVVTVQDEESGLIFTKRIAR